MGWTCPPTCLGSSRPCLLTTRSPSWPSSCLPCSLWPWSVSSSARTPSGRGSSPSARCPSGAPRRTASWSSRGRRPIPVTFGAGVLIPEPFGATRSPKSARVPSDPAATTSGGDADRSASAATMSGPGAVPGEEAMTRARTPRWRVRPTSAGSATTSSTCLARSPGSGSTVASDALTQGTRLCGGCSSTRRPRTAGGLRTAGGEQSPSCCRVRCGPDG